jgi:hypothetical protein
MQTSWMLRLSLANVSRMCASGKPSSESDRNKILQTETLPGQLGKVNFPVNRYFSLLMVGPMFVAGCGLPSRLSRNLGTGETLAIYGAEGRWAGPVTPSDTSCGQTTTGLMSVGSGAFGFDPFQSTTVIQGTVANGTLRGTLTRTGANKHALSISFEGQAGEDAQGKDQITGTLLSGRCRWNVALKRG